MKNDPNIDIISKLSRIGEEHSVLERPESKSAFLKNLDDLITSLSRLRAGLTHSSPEGKAAEIRGSLKQVVGFLKFAKTDESLKALLSTARKTPTPRSKERLVEIPNDLTNEQIRAFLEKDLSKAELKAIAGQRAISVGKSKNEEIKRDILRNLERQEGYVRLASSGNQAH